MTKFNTFYLVSFNYEIDDIFNVWAKVALNGKYYEVICDVNVYSARVDTVYSLIDIDEDIEIDTSNDDLEYVKDNLNHEIATRGCRAIGLPDLGGDYSVEIEEEGGDVRIWLTSPVFVYDNQSNCTKMTYITSFHDVESTDLKELEDYEIIDVLNDLLLSNSYFNISKRYEVLENEPKPISDDELLELFKKAL